MSLHASNRTLTGMKSLPFVLIKGGSRENMKAHVRRHAFSPCEFRSDLQLLVHCLQDVGRKSLRWFHVYLVGEGNDEHLSQKHELPETLCPCKGLSWQRGTRSDHPAINGFSGFFQPSSYWGTPIYGNPQLCFIERGRVGHLHSGRDRGGGKLEP